jgi:hypothetical protein
MRVDDEERAHVLRLECLATGRRSRRGRDRGTTAALVPGAANRR